MKLDSPLLILRRNLSFVNKYLSKNVIVRRSPCDFVARGQFALCLVGHGGELAEVVTISWKGPISSTAAEDFAPGLFREGRSSVSSSQ